LLLDGPRVELHQESDGEVVGRDLAADLTGRFVGEGGVGPVAGVRPPGRIAIRGDEGIRVDGCQPGGKRSVEP
jgi:hypothetical protein